MENKTKQNKTKTKHEYFRRFVILYFYNFDKQIFFKKKKQQAYHDPPLNMIGLTHAPSSSLHPAAPETM